VNYHSHTKYCDGTSAPEDFIKEAIRLGLPAYGYSSHAPVYFDTDWCIPDTKLADYLMEIREIKKGFEKDLQIYLGLEIDFIPGLAGRMQHLLKDIELDYFIGSVHFVESFADGTHWNIDSSYELFIEGLKDIYNSDFKKAATRFYEITRQMIEEDRPDVIGHIDKIKMYNPKGHFFNENDTWYQEQVMLTIDTLKKCGGIVEINTRAYYKYNQLELYPSDWIISLIHKAGIPLMISSDSHSPSEIIKGMNYAAAKLKTLSIHKITALYNRNWCDYEFNEDGIFFS
jgi:histidinol-phosphatase (PHP family)